MNTQGPKKNQPSLLSKAGTPFILILICTIALLVVFTVGLLVVTLMEDDGDSAPSLDGDRGGRVEEENNNPSVQVGGNLTPIYVAPTQKSRSDYRATNNGTAQQISGITSGCAILIDLNSFTSVAEKNADAKIYPASMTKVMTLVVACEALAQKNVDLNTELTVDSEMIKFAYAEEGSGKMKTLASAGTKFRINDLLYLIAYDSDTIASMMIANYIAGDEPSFVALMNQKVAELGMSSTTHFANSTGLHHAENYSTCRDIAAIMAYAKDNAHAWKLLSSTGSRQIRSTDGKVSFSVTPTWFVDRFATKNTLSTVTVKGGKTGFTDQSGMCLVSYAEGAQSSYIQVICAKAADGTGGGVSAKDSTEEVKKIYNTYVK